MTSLSRRLFLKRSSLCGGLALSTPLQSFLRDANAKEPKTSPGYGPLQPVNDESTGLPLLQLPDGFQYSSYAWTGDKLPGGAIIPGSHDGMGVVAEDKGVITIVRNQEVNAVKPSFAPVNMTYDPVAGGGCMTLRFDSKRGKWLDADFSLGGTVKNCAGGVTPWGTWLSCEESVLGPGDIENLIRYDYQKEHGWIFEVDPVNKSISPPLKSMGRFVHEAIAVDPKTGIVYETEDRTTAGFYRFLPNVKNKLQSGGTLQMAKVSDNPDLRKAKEIGKKYAVEWVTIEDPERAHQPGTKNTLGVYQQGKDQQATTFARLEGCWYGNDRVYFNATSGGPAQAGQVWEFDPQASTVSLVFVSPGAKVLDQPDNLAVSPRGGIVLCEDGNHSPQRLHGLTQDGLLFDFAANNISLNRERNRFKGNFYNQEWAGTTFSSDGKWLFANIQTPGITFAITGPWQKGLI